MVPISRLRLLTCILLWNERAIHGAEALERMVNLRSASGRGDGSPRLVRESPNACAMSGGNRAFAVSVRSIAGVGRLMLVAPRGPRQLGSFLMFMLGEAKHFRPRL